MADSQSVIELANKAHTDSRASKRNLDDYLWSYSKGGSNNTTKRLLDYESIENWKGVGGYLSVSNDGNFFAYTLEKGHHHNDIFLELDSLVIQSIDDNGVRWTFGAARPGFFTEDSKRYVLQSFEGNLCVLQLDKKQIWRTEAVTSYKVSSGSKWLAWQLKKEPFEVIIYNLITEKEIRLPGVSAYQFDRTGEWLTCEIQSKSQFNGTKELLLVQLSSGKVRRFSDVVNYSLPYSGKSLLLHTKEKKNGTVTTALQYLNLIGKNAVKTIWSTMNGKIAIASHSVDFTGKQVVFSLVDSSSIARGASIWYFKNDMDSAILKVSNESSGVPYNYIVQTQVGFTENDHHILFSLQQNSKSLINKSPEILGLEVWSYKDKILHGAKAGLNKKAVTAVLSPQSQTFYLLEKEGRELFRLQGDYAIVKKSIHDSRGDRFWETGFKYDSCWLVSLANGSEHLLPTRCAIGNDNCWFSPSGKYLVYFDAQRNGQYFSYDLDRKVEKNISLHMPANELLTYVDPYGYSSDSKIPNGIAAWFQGGDEVLVYAQQDIWLLHLTGKKSAICITNRNGFLHNIVFSLINGDRLTLNYRKIPVIKKNDTLLLQSFNLINKNSGFYLTIPANPGVFRQLNSGPYFYNLVRGCYNLNLSNSGHKPIKSKNALVWIVQRQSSTEAPNYYKTTNFISFTRLTNFQPHSKYNWFTQELHTFQHLDGKNGQGILFKPENFDSSKKYPVLIIIYQSYSSNLFQFRVPSLNRTVITPGASPAWFISNGYLVFTPDMHVAPLKYGPTAFKVVEGAIRYLKQLPFIDSSKIGCGSHSWSAKLGAYVFTHSRSITATAISEGFVYGNMINTALSTAQNGWSYLEAIETSFQFGNLWQNKDLWLDQTTVLQVDNANSPLLLFCNRGSLEDYQNQTLQLFIALRRLDKKVWWLKYDKGGHLLSDINEMKDFTTRITQYFDHYLKEAPAPKWMTQGMSEQSNGVVDSYSLDPKGSCANSTKWECTICLKWNAKYSKDPMMFENPISEWQLSN